MTASTAAPMSLLAFLPIATLAVICGVDSWTETGFLGHQRQARLVLGPAPGG